MFILLSKLLFFTVTFHKRFVKINEPQPTLLFFQRGLLVTYWSESQSLGHKTRYKVPFHQRKLPPKSASIYLVLEAKFYSYWQGKGQWNSNKSLKDLRVKTGGKQFSRLFSILKLCRNWIAKSYHFHIVFLNSYLNVWSLWQRCACKKRCLCLKMIINMKSKMIISKNSFFILTRNLRRNRQESDNSKSNSCWYTIHVHPEWNPRNGYNQYWR